MVDVFGFSRGAAQARAFVNEVFRLSTIDSNHWGGPVIRFRFIGVFDTVASEGGDRESVTHRLASRELTGPIILNLHPQCAQHVLHLTANDEERNYIPSTPLMPIGSVLPANFREEAWPGSHADIGGSYLNEKTRVYYPIQTLDWDSDAGRLRKERELKQALERFYFRPGIDITLGRIERPFMVDDFSGSGTEYAPYWERDVSNELEHVTLKRMHEYAVACGVPLNELSELDGVGYGHAVSPELAGMVAAVRKDGNRLIDRNSPAYQALYQKYIHHSHQFRFVPSLEPRVNNAFGVNDNEPEYQPDQPAPNGRREIIDIGAFAPVPPPVQQQRGPIQCPLGNPKPKT